MIALYKKLNISENEFKSALNNMYINSLSQQDIANFFKCHITVIEKYFKKYNIQTRKRSEQALCKIKHFDFFDNQKEIFDGIILSDGHISETSNISCRFTCGFKYKQTLERIKQDLFCLEFSNILYVEKTLCYYLKSHSYAELLEQRKRWYPNGVKIVPRDIILTPNLCYWWYIGDGSNIKYGLQLSTESFSEDDVLFLVDKLNQLSFKCTRTPSNNRIRISSKSKYDFLNYISDNIEIQNEYLYKWK
jgi:hypothetical protein